MYEAILSSMLRAAFSVNVVMIIDLGWSLSTHSSFKQRKTSTSVLPDPGPAIIHNGP